MKQIKNLEVSEKANEKIRQGESCFKYFVLGFLALCWLCRDVTHGEFGKPVTLYRASYHTSPGSDASTLNLLLDWFKSGENHE